MKYTPRVRSEMAPMTAAAKADPDAQPLELVQIGWLHPLAATEAIDHHAPRADRTDPLELALALGCAGQGEQQAGRLLGR